jgi:adenosylmethionine-8-amino-7-oxononanoate aminotransferase
MTRIIQRNPSISLPVAVRGQGVYLYDSNGREYLDASGGAAVSCLGHGHPDILAAMRAQLDKLAFAHSSFFTTEVAETLADTLVAGAPAGISHAYFVCDGSEANEAAMKMARQYFVDIGQPQRKYLIARRQSYHGNTLGALAITGREWNRAPFTPLLIKTTHVSPCFEYREKRIDETPEQYGARLARELDDTIRELGSDQVIAFIAETVGGATAGCTTPVPGYFKRVREVCDRHGVLLILDEVMCGMGRTGSMHACTAEGVAPDLMTIAKGLGGGYQAIGAVLAQQKIVDAFRQGLGAFQHGHTYLAHPMGAAAALAVQRVIARDDLLDNVKRQGAGLVERLKSAFAEHPYVGDIRGRGLFQAIELVQDRATKAPFPAADKISVRLKAEAMARGLCCYPASGTVDGRVGDHVMLAPPFIITDSQLDQLVERLKGAVDAVTGKFVVA